MKVQILGTGCPKCVQLAINAENAINELGLDAEIVKVNDITDIMEFGVIMTPALAIDGVVKVVGKVSSIQDIKIIINKSQI
jgi:small redox-active disulfide protein 2